MTEGLGVEVPPGFEIGLVYAAQRVRDVIVVGQDSLVTGGRMRGLTKVPAQLCGDDRAVISVRPAARPASFWNVLPPAEQADLAAAAAGSWNGQNCTIVLIDIANFGTRTRNDRDRRRIRVVLYQISQSLFENPDRQHDYHREDRGDEILLIIPPHVPTSSVVDRILDNLATPLCRYNSTAAPATRIQMRVALHVGPVVSDAHGVDGLAIIHASRLLDASALRRHLAETGADLGFITSPFVYDTIIQPNPGPVDPAGYRQLKCRVKKQAFNAWIYLAQKSGEIRPATAKAAQIG